MLSVVNANCYVRLIRPKSEDFRCVADVDPRFTSRSVLADFLALPILSLLNNKIGNPAPFAKSNNPAAVDDATDNTPPVPVCGSIVGGIRCLPNTPGMLKMTKFFAQSCKRT